MALTITVERPGSAMGSRLPGTVVAYQVQMRTCECCGIGVMGDTLCSGCQGRLTRAANALAKMNHKDSAYLRKVTETCWEMFDGVDRWQAATPLAVFLKAVQQAQYKAGLFADSVAKSAAVGRANSTAQREFDRIQDIVSKAIETLGVELKYA